MKRLMTCCFILGLFAIGCGPSGENNLVRAQEPTPTPQPSPLPVIGVAAGEEHSSFWDGLYASETQKTAEILPLARENELLQAQKAGCGVLIVYLEEEDGAAFLDKAAETGIPLLVFSPKSLDFDGWTPGLSYDPRGAPQAALNAALHCDPHDTPVRLAGLFDMEEEEGEAARQAWKDYIARGLLLDKGSYQQNARQSAESFMEKLLGAYPPGTIDGVYAQNEALALEAARALIKDGRPQMEIFCSQVSDNLLLHMLTEPLTIYALSGPNEMFAGRYLMDRAGKVLSGEDGGETATLFATLFLSPSLKQEWDALWLRE